MLRRTRESVFGWANALDYRPHPKQRLVMDAFADERFNDIVVVCGRRWGKTNIAAFMACYALQETGCQIWVVSKTYDLATRIWYSMMPMIAPFRSQWRIRDSKQEYSILTPWGAHLELKSADHPDGLLGGGPESKGLDLLIQDEAATFQRKIQEQFLAPSLADRRGLNVRTTTPRGFNHIYEDYERGQSPDFPDYFSIRSPSMDNPYIRPEAWDKARRETDPILWAQEFMAEFVAFVGQVYSLFDRERHVIETAPDLTGWSISAAVDPGLANPTAILWIAHHPTTGEDIVIDEVVQSGLLFPDVLRLLNEHKPAGGYDLLVCDIAGRARSQETGASFIGWMKGHGLRFKAHSQGIVDGVNCVRSRFVDADGNVHLKIAARCVKTIEALQGYHYPEKDGEQSEEPEKDGVFDHPMDALRYYTTYRHTRKPGRSWQT